MILYYRILSYIIIYSRMFSYIIAYSRTFSYILVYPRPPSGPPPKGLCARFGLKSSVQRRNSSLNRHFWEALLNWDSNPIPPRPPN